MSLSEEEMKSISTLDKGHRFCNPPWGVTVFVSFELGHAISNSLASMTNNHHYQ